MKLSTIIKILAAISLALLLVITAGAISKKAINPKPLAKNAYVVDVAAANAALAKAASQPTAVPAATATKAGDVDLPPIADLLAKADIEAGQKTAKQCAVCHSFGKGEPSKNCPNLYGIVGNKHAHMPGFNYSQAMMDMAKHETHMWDYDELNHFLRNPREHLPGTKMAFAGLKNDQERANVIAWLRTLADKPMPMPK